MAACDVEKRNYDKSYFVKIEGNIIKGWGMIAVCLVGNLRADIPPVVELYTDLHEDEVLAAFGATGKQVTRTRNPKKPQSEIERVAGCFTVEDVLFGVIVIRKQVLPFPF